MDTLVRKCVAILKDAASKTSDNYVMGVCLPVHSSEEREIVGSILKKMGIVDQWEPFGKNMVRCKVNIELAEDYLDRG